MEKGSSILKLRFTIETTDVYILDPDGEKIVKDSKQKRGIAIIVNCDYSDTQSLDTLLGTKKDAEEMKVTLDVLRFHSITLHNPVQTEIKREVQKLSSALPLLEDVSRAKFKAIIFVFSGHGKDSDMLLSQDGKEVNLIADIVHPLIGHRQIKHIPKLFFIDACRGDKQLKQVHSKGPTEKEANFRIDYATVPHHVSFMAEGSTQSEWLPTLAYELRTKNDSVQNIVATVNQKVFHRTQERGGTGAQQGETVDRLNVGPLYLYTGFDEGSDRSHTEL